MTEGSDRALARLNFLERDALHVLHTGRAWAWLSIGLAWAAVALSFSLLWLLHSSDVVSVVSLPVSAVLVVVVGWSQFVVSNLLHEAVHGNLGDKTPDWIAALLTAWPIGFSMGYRGQHLNHHRYFGDPARDPDYPAYRLVPASRFAFVAWLVRNFSGLGAVFRLREISRATERSGGGVINDKVGVILVQFAILICLWSIFGTPLAYALWIGPLMTVAKGLSALRTLCEHGSPEGKPILRTFVAPSAKLLGSIGFDRHAEHHLYPTIPFSSLPELHLLHESAVASCSGRQSAFLYEAFHGGHFGLLALWFRSAPWRVRAINGASS